jgi:hypothetical protein
MKKKTEASSQQAKSNSISGAFFSSTTNIVFFSVSMTYNIRKNLIFKVLDVLF